MKVSSVIIFAFVVAISAFNWLAVKTAMEYVSPEAFTLQRFMLASVALVPILFILRKELPKDSRMLIKLIPFSLLYSAVAITQSMGLVTEGVGIGSVLTYTYPLITFCIAVPLLSEEATQNKIIGTLVGFSGVVVLFIGETNSFAFGGAFIMLSTAIFWALSNVYYKKYLQTVSPSIAIFFQLLLGTIPVFFIGLLIKGSSFIGASFFPLNSLYIVLVLYSSIISLAIGNSLWFLLVRREEVTTVSSSSLIIPAATLILGWQALGEGLNLQVLFGSLITFTGLFVVNLRNRNEPKDLNPAREV